MGGGGCKHTSNGSYRFMVIQRHLKHVFTVYLSTYDVSQGADSCSEKDKAVELSPL